MIQGSRGERLLFKTPHTLSIKRKSLRQDLDRYFAFETRVPGAVDLAHAARAQ